MANTTVNNMAAAISRELEKYKGIAVDCIKTAAQDAGRTVQNKIRSGAPAMTGKYAKSWKTKVTKETPLSVEVTVYSPTRYQLAHLLEHGHALRGGGRTRAQIHISPAEQEGIDQFEKELKRGLENG